MTFETTNNGIGPKLAKILTALGVVAALLFFFLVINWTTIEGHERAVTQDWREGVSSELWGPGTHFYMPLTTTVYTYDIGTNKFIMGNRTTQKIETTGHGERVVKTVQLYGDNETIGFPPVTITTGGEGKEQPATFSVTLQYHLDPVKLVALHNSVQDQYGELTIKPALTRIISDLATTRPVLAFYSGDGRVELQKEIEQSILENKALSDVGIAVETFVIDDIALDPQYVSEITGRQIATQAKLREVEEAGAAKARAERVESEALADKLKRIMEAEASKEEKIRAAEAQAAEIRALAEADRFKKEQDAKGLLAQGMAEAQVDQAKKVSKYEGVAGARQAQVEIEVARTERLKNFHVTGVLPEKTAMTLIGGDINKVPAVINAAQ